MEPRDFSDRADFPGAAGGRFDLLVILAEKVQALPEPLFAGLLLILALLATRAHRDASLALFTFFLTDWALIALLPWLGLSFGPPKPPTLALALLRAPAALLPPTWNWPLQGLGTLLLLYGFYIEPQRLTHTRETLEVPGWRGIPPLRLLHLGDLHIERITPRERRLIEFVREAKPDLILFSGDFLNYSYLEDTQAWAAARELLSTLQAPLGAYCVSGTPAVDLEHVLPKLLEGTPLKRLRDERLTLNWHGQPVDILGVSCTHKPFVDLPRLKALLPCPPEHLTLLLYHSPDLAPEAAALGIDLQLSGHTHGGQVRLPFLGPLYASSLYGKRFAGGRYRVGSMTLYVTRGLGMEGKGAPRVRTLCPPEVTLWELRPTLSQGAGE
jgi:predicted MPP superfamily phosphohydrolase